MRGTDADTRRRIGCGFLPPNDEATPWTHVGYTGPKPKTCIGYTMKLPEVVEASFLRLWSSTNQLQLRIGDPTEDVLDALELLELSWRQTEAWDFEQQKLKQEAR